MPGDTFDVRGLEAGGIGLAAIGTFQAVNPFEGFFVQLGQLVENAVSLPGMLGFFEKSPVNLLTVPRLFCPVMQQITHI